MSEKSVFREAWSPENNDVTIIPSLLFLVLWFTPPEVKFDAFGTSKHREGKSQLKKCFCYTYHCIGEIWSSKYKKICHMHFNSVVF